MEPDNYLTATRGWKRWLFTLDHKRIALLYLFSLIVMLTVGGLLAIVIRVHLLKPDGFLTAEVYGRIVAMHGITMIFFFLVPCITATLGNFLLPIMIGAENLAFPRLNLLCWYLYLAGALLCIYALPMNGVGSGWTFYTPYSTTYSSSYVLPSVTGVFITGLSSIFTGFNFVVTVHKKRAPGMSWGRLPLFVWAHYASGIIQILGMPLLAIAFLIVAFERLMHIGVFDPVVGGDPILFAQSFNFGSHSFIDIMILTAMGVVTEVICCFSKKRIFGYKFVAASLLAVAMLGFMIWGLNIFLPTESAYLGLFLSCLSFLPSALIAVNWLTTMFRGSVRFQSPMFYALEFIALFVIGGFSNLYRLTFASNVALNGTYFVVASLHIGTVGCMLLAFMAGLHFWWPKMTGRMYPEAWAKVAAILTFIGILCAFIPQFILGYLGVPRRYAAYPSEFQALNITSSTGAFVLGIALLIPLIYLTWSWFRGPKAGSNPWNAAGLEWQIDSPPITANFPQPPTVTDEAYNYGS